MDSCFTCGNVNCVDFVLQGNIIGCVNWISQTNLSNPNHIINRKDKIINNLVYTIQRLEREKVDLTVDDIETVWNAKTLLGFSHPVSIEEGTGSMLIKITI